MQLASARFMRICIGSKAIQHQPQTYGQKPASKFSANRLIQCSKSTVLLRCRYVYIVKLRRRSSNCSCAGTGVMPMCRRMDEPQCLYMKSVAASLQNTLAPIRAEL
eukprot:2036206-Amphidinium_carterae.1